MTEFGVCARIEVTASQRPISYNGMKIVKLESRPLDDVGDFNVFRRLAGSQEWVDISEVEQEANRTTETGQNYVDCILTFTDVIASKSLRIVVN